MNTNTHNTPNSTNTPNTMLNYFHTSEAATVTDYPYGSLRTSATFGLEFKADKGFRTTFQTINPKTGRANAVKKSTYSDIMVMYQEPSTGHIRYQGWMLRGEEDVNKVAEFMSVHFDLFTPEQVAHIYRCMFACIKITAKAMVIYSGADFEQVKPVLQPATDAIVKGIREGLNYFDQISIDAAALDACRKPDYQPFKVVGPVSIFELHKLKENNG